MAEIGLHTLLINSKAREMEEQKEKTRRRNLLILIHHYLNEQGYIRSAENLNDEVAFNLNQYEVCDNVNLEIILQEFEVFYYAKFRKYPHLTKKSNEGIKDENNKKKLHNKYRNSSQNNNGNNQVSSDCLKEDNFKILQSYAAFPKHNDEWNELAQVILKTDGHWFIQCETSESKHPATIAAKVQAGGGSIMVWGMFLWHSPSALVIVEGKMDQQKFASVYVDHVHPYMQIVFPQNDGIYQQYPELFSGLLSPWKGLLLFGPPGTGKTMLAKAVATECQTTFFNISAATIISKWRGDSEKLIRVLFELARFYAPSTIFLDEIDSLMGQRVFQSGNEHEASRRMKTELMIQMDGLARSDHLVFVLAASNIPWELDHAILRRLEKRILVSLPNREIRIALFQQFLPPTVVQNKIICVKSNLDYYCLADETDGYSGADIKLVCKETVMNCIRNIFNLLENHIQGRELPSVSLESIKTTDVLLAISRTKPSARNFADQYNSWQEEFGSN
ncbi:katanin p60 ATPase-containing subunit A-like 2 [Centruroides sculpturatus]|uniref:katanin p60 ATPase-containing subunit A-like 2 n=1 Tax=Centruroides sculpturatus TaxID=218467 RepID=UPI000C6E96ED|nr:katanin p60 ATPase-containing subunit A-like 2 [Centruroides sculpturatus]